MPPPPLANVSVGLGSRQPRSSKPTRALVAHHVAPAHADEGFSAYTMQEEREVAGMGQAEAAAGEVELF